MQSSASFSVKQSLAEERLGKVPRSAYLSKVAVIRHVKRSCVISLLLVRLGADVVAQCNQDTYRLLIDGAGVDVAHRVLLHANGDIYVGGFSNSFGSSHDLLLVRFTPTGSMVWAKRYDVAGDDGGQSMYLATGPSGGLYLGATLAGIATSQEDGSLLKLDEDGNVLWARRVLPMPFYCQVRAIAERPDGDIIIVGSANSIGAGNADSYAARFDANGNLAWLNSYGWTGQDHFTHIELLGDGSFLACSQSMGPTASNRKGYVARIAADGTPIGCALHNGGNYENYNHGVANADGTFLWVGFTESYGAGGRDVLAVLTDDDGGIIWSRAYGTALNDEGLNAVVDPAGGWRISAFSGPQRVAHVLRVLPNGDLDQVRQLPDLVIPPSALWAEVLEAAAAGGFYFVGSDASLPAGGIAIEKLDACAEPGCGGTLVTWTMAAPNIPQLTPALPISASSTNVTAVNPAAFTISTVLQQGIDFIDCDTCNVSLAQSGLNACLGEPVLIQPGITAADPGALQWSWDLGDGALSDAQDELEHVYTVAGEYTVLLIVSDTSGGCADTLAFNVSVAEVPTPDLGPDSQLCPGDGIILDPGDAGSASVLWSDGTMDATLQAQNAGVYWVVFEQGGCSAADTVLIQVEVVPELLLASAISLCVGDSMLVEAEPGWSNWQWSDGGLGESVWVSDDIVLFLQAEWNGCTAFDSISVNVTAPPAVDLGPDMTACEGAIVVLSTGLAGLAHLWSDGSTSESLAVSGSAEAWVQVGPTGCSGSDTVLVIFIAPPIADLGPDALLCDGASTVLGPAVGGSVLWSDGSTGATLTVTEPGAYTVTITNQVCSSRDEVIITTANSPQVLLPEDTVACGVASIGLIPLALQEAGTILWSNGSQDEAIVASASGAYWVEVVNGCGSASDTVMVTLADELVVDLGPDLVLCGDGSVSINTGFPMSTVLWSTGETAGTVVVSTPGLYWVQVLLNGCSGGDTVAVNWSPLPSILLSEDAILCEAGSASLVAVQVIGNVIWSTGDSAQSILAEEPGIYVAVASNACGTAVDSVRVTWASAMEGDSLVSVCWGEQVLLALPSDFTQVLWGSGVSDQAIIVEPGEHAWVATDAFGCSRSGRFIVAVDSLRDGLLIVPNVFTPNGDGENDRFRVVGADVGDFSLTIFNRWGEEIWSTIDPRDSWDGTYGGSTVPDGTYVYVLRHAAKCTDDNGRRERVGHLTLLR